MMLRSKGILPPTNTNGLLHCSAILEILHPFAIRSFTILEHKEIEKELENKCRETFPNSEWLVQTEKAAGFYEKLNFEVNKDFFYLFLVNGFNMHEKKNRKRKTGKEEHENKNTKRNTEYGGNEMMKGNKKRK